MWQRLVMVGLAGAVGTTARYTLAELVQKIMGGNWPWGTLAVNMLGCFLFGMVWVLSDEQALISEEARIVTLGGFMGAFTTFSTFIFDTGGYIRQEQWALASWHVVVQTVVGLAFLFVGMTAARWV